MSDLNNIHAYDYVSIDALNFVVGVDVFGMSDMSKLDATFSEILELDLDNEQQNYVDELLVQCIQSEIVKIFGDEFGNFVKKTNGIHFYKNAYYVKSEQGDIILNIGFGGQRNTVFFGLTGAGCQVAPMGWQSRLHDFLQAVPTAKITRIDLAHDDLDGKYSSFDLANLAESDDRFLLCKTRNRPACTFFGEYKNGDPLQKGLTIAIGSRKNGKYFRGYEKGKQLGDTSSNWFRSEIEIHAKKRVIPFDVLLSPEDYFVSSYPFCEDLIKLAKKNSGSSTPIEPKKMQVLKKAEKITLLRAIDILKVQFGKYIKTFGDIFKARNSVNPDYKLIFDKLKTDEIDDYCPPRLSLSLRSVSNILPSKKYIKNIKKDNKLRQVYRENKNFDECEIFGFRVLKPSAVPFVDFF